MARPKLSLSEKIEQQSSWDEDHLHLHWHGRVRRGHPTVRDERQKHIHPVRHLLNLDHPRLVAKRQCLHADCIAPEHYEVRIKADPFKERPAPDWQDPRLPTFSIGDQSDIDWGLELLSEGKTLAAPEFEDIPQHLIEEIKRRWHPG